MLISPLAIPGLLLIEPKRIADKRGFFSETFRVDKLEAAVGSGTLVQENHSYSKNKGTVRGLHYQRPPYAQGKLIRVTRGAILDVAVDARRGSPTYGRFNAVELSADNWRQLWVPPEFLHGFCTLVDDVEVIYKTTAYYNADSEGGIRWNDPEIAIPWPVSEADAKLSGKDRMTPFFRDMPPIFEFQSA